MPTLTPEYSSELNIFEHSKLIFLAEQTMLDIKWTKGQKNHGRNNQTQPFQNYHLKIKSNNQIFRYTQKNISRTLCHPISRQDTHLLVIDVEVDVEQVPEAEERAEPQRLHEPAAFFRLRGRHSIPGRAA